MGAILYLMALDFIKVDDGFLFCDLMPSGNVKRLVHTDNDCKIMGSPPLSDGYVQYKNNR